MIDRYFGPGNNVERQDQFKSLGDLEQINLKKSLKNSVLKPQNSLKNSLKLRILGQKLDKD